MAEIRVLSSGVDTLHLRVRGTVREEVWDQLDAARTRSTPDEPEVVELGDTGQAFGVQPHGWKFFPLWLRSPDYELMLGNDDRFPAGVVQLHSAYLHSFGVWPAVRLAESTLRRAVMAGPAEPTVSRIDLYADVEGWPLQVEDLRRFVSRARGRSCHPVADEEESDRFWQLGRHLSGIEFGRRGGGVYVRIYDKSAEIKLRGNSWLPALWGERQRDGPVRRIEFELRRKKLRERGLCTVEEALEGQQDLWRYATHQWLTHRTPQRDARVRRWPMDPIWQRCRRSDSTQPSWGWCGACWRPRPRSAW